MWIHCCCLQTHQKRASDPITDGCEPPCVVAGNWTQEEQASALIYWAISPAPVSKNQTHSVKAVSPTYQIPDKAACDKGRKLLSESGFLLLQWNAVTKSNLRGRVGLCFHTTAHHWRKAEQELRAAGWRQELMRDHEEVLLTGLLMVCSAFLIEPRTTSPGLT